MPNRKKTTVEKWKQIYRRLLNAADENEKELTRALMYSMKILK